MMCPPPRQGNFSANLFRPAKFDAAAYALVLHAHAARLDAARKRGGGGGGGGGGGAGEG